MNQLVPTVGVLLWLAQMSCPGAPALAVTKYCPSSPPGPGEPLFYFGTVVNVGTETLTNVVVMNIRPAASTTVAVVPTLAPGGSYVFSGYYPAPTNACSVTDTLQAAGYGTTGPTIAQTTTTCPISTTPTITITKTCPAGPVPLGAVLQFSVVVSNAGNITLTNATVTDDHAGFITTVASLAPGRTTNYLASYTPTNCGPNIATTVTIRCNSACGGVVSNSVTSGCTVICPAAPPLILNPHSEGNYFVFSFQTESNRLYTVQFTDSLSPANWQTLTNFLANGNLAVVRDATTSPKGFYRFFVQ